MSDVNLPLPINENNPISLRQRSHLSISASATVNYTEAQAWKMDMRAHIYGWIGLCGCQTQMKEKCWYSLRTVPSPQSAVCTLNSGVAGREWLRSHPSGCNWNSHYKNSCILSCVNKESKGAYQSFPNAAAFNTKASSTSCWAVSFFQLTKKLFLWFPAVWLPAQQQSFRVPWKHALVNIVVN